MSKRDHVPAPQLPARITYKAGEEVSVFYRCGDSDSYMPVASYQQGLRTPRVGQTHGWVSAAVTTDFDSHGGDTEVKLRYTHEKWVDRSGEILNIEEPRNMHAVHPPGRVRKGRNPQGMYLEDNGTGLARIEVAVSIVLVRWSDENCDEVKEGDSGWGPTGAVVSDSYVNIWLEAFDCAFPCDYQIVTVWVASSEDMANVAHIAAHLRPSLHGRHLGAFYFLWPCQSFDAQHIPSGYVDLPAVMGAMTAVEGAGIPTRFPHSSHLYKVFLSKDWTSQLCLFPEMRVPATTKVSRWMVERDPLQAAKAALLALGKLVTCQDEKMAKNQNPSGAGKGAAAAADKVEAAGDAAAAQPQPARGKDRDCLAASSDPTVRARCKGVAKLGFSWEANDVLKFSGEVELAQRLGRLFNQAQGTPEFAFVQDLIEDFDVEVRTFVVNGSPVTHARRFTQFAHPVDVDGEEGREAGRYSCFERGGRDMALHKWLHGNDIALKDAETKVDELIGRFVLWLSTECCECPPVFRFDAFLRLRGTTAEEKANTTVCDVFSGELTELGACTLGWEISDMVSHLFPAVLGSCLDDKRCRHPSCPCKRPLAPRPPPAPAAAAAAPPAAGGGGGGAAAGVPGVTCCGGAPGRDRRCNVAPFAKELKRRSEVQEARHAEAMANGSGGDGEDGEWHTRFNDAGDNDDDDDDDDGDDDDGDDDGEEDEDGDETGDEVGGDGGAADGAIRAAKEAIAGGGSASAAAEAAEKAAAKKKTKRIRAKNNKAKDKRKKRGGAATEGEGAES